MKVTATTLNLPAQKAQLTILSTPAGYGDLWINLDKWEEESNGPLRFNSIRIREPSCGGGASLYRAFEAMRKLPHALDYDRNLSFPFPMGVATLLQRPELVRACDDNPANCLKLSWPTPRKALLKLESAKKDIGQSGDEIAVEIDSRRHPATVFALLACYKALQLDLRTAFRPPRLC